jgi:nitrogen fixation NifU-like protein
VLNYSPQVIDHFSNPRNLGALPDADVIAEVGNPCCGDRIRLYANVSDGRITRCTFLAYGCAAALAVGSLLTEAVVGCEIDDLAHFDEDHIAALAGGLRPAQRHCATLGRGVLHALARSYQAWCPKGALV